MPAKITIEAGEVPLLVARANMTVSPPQRIGEYITMPPGMKLELVVNAFQGVVVREPFND